MAAAVLLVTSCNGGAVAVTTSTTASIPTTTEPAIPPLPGAEAESTLEPGDLLAVVGAAEGVTHWLVAFPDGLGDVERELDPLDTGLEVLGRAWEVDGVLWELMLFEGREGYFPRSMLAFIGEPEDVTEQFTGISLGSVEELGAEIAGEIEATEMILIAMPDALELIYDVMGMEDDSVAGYRVRVVAVEASGGFAPELVERTPLCSRGLDDAGFCD